MISDQLLVRQVENEYQEGQDFLRAKKLRQVNQLILINNLRRGDQNIASSMLFTFFNRVFSNLYDDKIQIKFIPSEDADMKKTETLNKLAVNDYQEMEKSLIDYDWLWDTLFFGRGYCETINFDKEKKILVPTVINPLTMVYDPYFSNPKDWRYYGKWVFLSRHKINQYIRDKVISGIKTASEIADGADAEIWDYKVRREQAKEATPVSIESSSRNQIYQIYEGYTIDENGEKIIVWTDKNFSKILRKKKLSDILKKDEDWPIVVKEAFREPHSSVPVSLPDIVEDKHRALNVLYNLAYIAAKDEANPIYIYKPTGVVDTTQLFQRQVNQHIPVNEMDAIAPLNKDAALSNSLMAFMNLIKSEAADVMGTTQVTPIQPKGKKTATESAILQQIADLSQSLQSKVLSIGEKEFWSQWYSRYVNNMSSASKKTISLTGINPTFEEITMSDIKTKFPPRILVLSAKEAEYKQMVERRELSQQFPILSKSMTPESFSHFLKNVYLPKFEIMDSETIDLILPKSIDEIKAEQENEQLNNDVLAKIDPTDDDEAHLYVHAQAKNTPAKWAHYLTHEKQRAMKLKEKGQQPIGQPQAQVETGGSGGQETPQTLIPQKKSKKPVPSEPKDMMGAQEMGQPPMVNGQMAKVAK